MSVFLFTDIEGSTKKWEQFPEEMKRVLSRHDEILKECVEKYKGRVVKHTGDGIFAVFDEGEPLQCALAIQSSFEKEEWGKIGELRVRIGLHSGHAEVRQDDYFGPAINRTARVMGAAWGGQTVLTPEVKTGSSIPKGAMIKDLGVHQLKDLGEPQQLYQLVHPDIALKEFPPLHSLSFHPHNLPIQATPFLGREEELKEVIKLIENPSCRLITLIGPGGIGKTRLAIQAAAERIESFSHGVFFIPLDPLTSADFLVSTIAEALKFSFYSKEDEKVQLLNYLREKQVLLILDNFEHLVEGAKIISDILNSANDVKIIVTSRELLNLRGEWIIQVNGMPVPKGENIDIEGYSAIQMFLQSAKRIRSDITLSDEDRRYVVRICQLVGGLPLGIEIASSWLRTLSCKEIAQEIEKNIDFLATSMRDVPERHRSLKAVFDYSWNLLTEEEKTVLKKLGVFHGGFQRDAAEYVAQTSLPVLSSLVDKSLLKRHPSGRYEILDILRQFIVKELRSSIEEHESVRNLHCDFFSDFLDMRKEPNTKEEREKILNIVAGDIDNLRIAWNWAIDKRKREQIEKVMKVLFYFYRMRGWCGEGLEIFSYGVDSYASEEDREMYAKILFRKGRFLSWISENKRAREVLEESLAILRPLDIKDEVGAALNVLGGVYRYLGNYEKSVKLQEESLSIFRNLGNEKGIALSLAGVAHTLSSMGEYEESNKLLEESLSLNRKIGDPYGVSSCLNDLGSNSHTVGDLSKAEEYYSESLKIARDLNHEYGIARTLNNMAIIKSALSEYEDALKCYRESIEVFKELGDESSIPSPMTNMAIIFRLQGKFDEAKRIHEETLEVFKRGDYKYGIVASMNHIAAVEKDQGNLKKAAKLHQEALAISRGINNPWMISITLENLAEVFFMMNDFEKAEDTYRESLKIAWDIKAVPLLLSVITGIANILIRKGKRSKGLEILFVVYNQSKLSKDLEDEVLVRIEELKFELKSDEFSAIEERGKTKSLEEVVTQILEGN
jgi:predicted ATPase/class 3 adenylate cyclase